MKHFLVLADALEAARTFYCEVLGLSQGPRPPLPFQGCWIYLAGIPAIHIAERSSYEAHGRESGVPVSPAAGGTGPLDHIAFNGQDYDEVLARLRRHQVALVCHDPPGAPVRQMFLSDPNGLKIEINFPARLRSESQAGPRPCGA